MKRERRAEHGFTLLELMVAVALLGGVLAGVFSLAVVQMRARKDTQQLLDVEQNARAALTAIEQDAMSAGLGLGYGNDDTFLGYSMGTFLAPATTTFDSNDYVYDTTNGLVTDDLRLRGADGPARTIVQYDHPLSSGSMEVCSGSGLQVGEKAIIVSSSYLDARAINVSGVTPNVVCSEDQCTETGRCDRVTFDDGSALFATHAGAWSAPYKGGVMFRGFFDVVYFVAEDAEGPALFRADRAAYPCSSRTTCSTPDNKLAEGVESVQVRVWEQAPGVYIPHEITSIVDHRNHGGPHTRNRIRLEVEVIARSKTEEPDVPSGQMSSDILPSSIFPSVSASDQRRRRKMTVSFELKNTGALRLESL